VTCWLLLYAVGCVVTFFALCWHFVRNDKIIDFPDAVGLAFVTLTLPLVWPVWFPLAALAQVLRSANKRWRRG
jgi:hypothetical protein